MGSLPLPVGSYQLADPRASVRRLVNCFVQAAPATPQLGPNPTDTKQTQPPVTLMRAAGITTWVDEGSGNPVRGLKMMAGTLYAVIGPTLYSVSTAGTLTQLGTGITGGTEFVRIDGNGACLCVLRPGTSSAWTYSSGGGFQTLTLQAAASDLGFIDTYLVFLQANGLGFYNDDGKAVSGTGQITFTSGAQFLRSFGTDLFVGMGIAHRAVMLIGTETGETYIDAGNAVGSPFSAAPDGLIQLGCGAGHSVALQDQALHWLANDLTVRRGGGQVPTRVSNHGIESVINAANIANQMSGVYALAYSYLGHLFYAITIPQAQRTLVLDVTTGEWHELSSVATGYWRPLCASQGYAGMQLVGDSQSSKIGYLDPTASTEFGDAQIMQWTHQAVYMENKLVSHRRLEILLGEGGQAPYSSTSTPPQITLKYSDDGGRTWKTAQQRDLGLTGDNKHRTFWTGLGSARQRVYQFTLSDQLAPGYVVDATIEAAAGRF